MKQILLLFTVLMSTISVYADDGDTYDYYWNKEIDGIYYNLDAETKIAEVTHDGKRDTSLEAYVPAGNSYSGDVIIPSSVTFDGETYSVTEISTWAFYNCPSLISVEIPNSVKRIGYRAFEGCTSLSYVKLPASLKQINSNVFDGCTSLASIEIPESVVSIYDMAFADCTSLSSITFPYSVAYINSYAFFGCTGLTTLNLSNSIIGIGQGAFSGCSELTSVTIGDGLSFIEADAFRGCSKLASVTILATTPPETEGTFVSYYGTLHVKKDCKEAYSNAEYWKNFNIVEDADAGVDDYTYKPMIEKGKAWNFEITHTYTKEKVELVRNYTLTINEDMGEGGWFKVYKTFENEGFDEQFYQEDSYYWLVEKDKVVSETYRITDSPNPLIDFSLHKGDQCVVDYDYYYRIVDEDYIRVKGHTYRRLHIDVNQDGIADDYWVEGIGSKNYNHITPFMKSTGGRFWYDDPRLLSVYKDGICIFERADFDTPGITSGIEKIACNSAKPIYGIYNPLGCRLTSAPRKGIYIKNGRKIIVK